jgi:hypothetical protein
VQEGESQPAFPPRPAHSHDIHPTLIPDDFAQHDGGEISPPSSARNHTEGSKLSSSPSTAGEALEGVARTPPHVPEGVLDGLIDHAFIPAGDEGADGYTCGPAGLWRGLIELGLHHVHTPRTGA